MIFDSRTSISYHTDSLFLSFYGFFNRNKPLDRFSETTFMKTLKLNSLKALFFGTIFALFTHDSYASLSSQAATRSQIQVQSSNTERNSASTSQKINNVYRNWAGTRYRLGGTTKSGIDCSAFVQVVMNKALHKNLPRATVGQKTVGKAIPKSALKAGDLVFFRQNKHVGVYIGNGKFVHSGSSTGVTTSSLSNSYWSKNYTQSRRVM